MQPGNLRRVLLTGTFWTAVATYGSGGITLLTTAVLTRYLMPAAFGVGAVIGATAAFFDLLGEMAIGTSVIQRRDLSHRQLSSIYWLAIGAAAAISLAFALAAPAAGHLFASREIAKVLPAVGVTVMIYAALCVPQAMLRRDLRFRAAAATHAAGSIAGAIAAISFAVAGFSYWAFVAQSIANAVARAAFATVASRWRPAAVADPRDASTIGGYASAMAANATINHWSRNLDTVIIGHFLGLVPLGLYNVAQRLIAAPGQLVATGMRPLLHPAFVRISDDLPRMRRGYVELVRVTALMMFSIAAIVVTAAEPLVTVVAGPRWLASVPLLRVLAVVAAVQPVNVLASSIFMTQNAPTKMLRSTAITAVALIAGMFLGLRWGTVGVAAAYVIVYLLVVVPLGSLFAYKRLLHGHVREWLASLVRPLISAAILLAVGTATAASLPSSWPPLARLLAICAADGIALLLFIRVAAWELVVAVWRMRSFAPTR